MCVCVRANEHIYIHLYICKQILVGWLVGVFFYIISTSVAIKWQILFTFTYINYIVFVNE